MLATITLVISFAGGSAVEFSEALGRTLEMPVLVLADEIVLGKLESSTQADTRSLALQKLNVILKGSHDIELWEGDTGAAAVPTVMPVVMLSYIGSSYERKNFYQKVATDRFVQGQVSKEKFGLRSESTLYYVHSLRTQSDGSMITAHWLFAKCTLIQSPGEIDRRAWITMAAKVLGARVKQIGNNPHLDFDPKVYRQRMIAYWSRKERLAKTNLAISVAGIAANTYLKEYLELLKVPGDKPIEFGESMARRVNSSRHPSKELKINIGGLGTVLLSVRLTDSGESQMWAQF